MSKIQIEKPDHGTLDRLGIDTWGRWECGPSAFPWHYDERETCYVFEGRVTVETPEGQTVEIGPGDLVTFPQGLSCTWTVHETIRKVYRFG